MNPEQRQELDARLQEHIGHVTGMLELGQSTMETLHLSTQEVQVRGRQDVIMGGPCMMHRACASDHCPCFVTPSHA